MTTTTTIQAMYNLIHSDEQVSATDFTLMQALMTQLKLKSQNIAQYAVEAKNETVSKKAVKCISQDQFAETKKQFCETTALTGSAQMTVTVHGIDFSITVKIPKKKIVKQKKERIVKEKLPASRKSGSKKTVSAPTMEQESGIDAVPSEEALMDQLIAQLTAEKQQKDTADRIKKSDAEIMINRESHKENIAVNIKHRVDAALAGAHFLRFESAPANIEFACTTYQEIQEQEETIRSTNDVAYSAEWSYRCSNYHAYGFLTTEIRDKLSSLGHILDKNLPQEKIESIVPTLSKQERKRQEQEQKNKEKDAILEETLTIIMLLQHLKTQDMSNSEILAMYQQQEKELQIMIISIQNSIGTSDEIRAPLIEQYMMAAYELGFRISKKTRQIGIIKATMEKLQIQ